MSEPRERTSEQRGENPSNSTTANLALKNEFILYKASLVSTILKNGITTCILGFEAIYQRYNSEKLHNELHLYGFKIPILQKAQTSVDFTFFLSLIILLFSILTFIYMEKRCRKLQFILKPIFFSKILIFTLLDSFILGFQSPLKIKTNLKDTESFFLFNRFNFTTNFFIYLFLYFPQIKSVNVPLYYTYIRGIYDTLWPILHFMIFNGNSENPNLNGFPLLSIPSIPDQVKSSLIKICEMLNINKETVLVPFSKTLNISRTLKKIDGKIYVPSFVLNNYTDMGLIGYFAYYMAFLKENFSTYLYIIASCTNIIALFVFSKLITFSQTLKIPALGIMFSIRILDFIEFISVILINYLQKFYELKVDQILKNHGFENELIEYFIQRSELKTRIENIHFSNILSFISPYNSLISRCKHIKDV